MRPGVLYCIEPGESSLLKQEMQMNGRRLHAAGAALATAVIVGGCVSQGTYDQLEADKNQEIAALQKQRGGLQEQVQGLQSQKTSLEQQHADLRRSEEHTSELQSQSNLVCRLLLEKKKNEKTMT